MRGLAQLSAGDDATGWPLGAPCEYQKISTVDAVDICLVGPQAKFIIW
jgi:cellobiose-specific phosphotransferase system component IIB